jgi:biopolymer transport protein ExbB/TolQ
MMDLILVALLSVAVFFLFVFVYVRENAINKKLKLYEKTFDLINQNMHKIEKEAKARPVAAKDAPDANMEEFSEVSRLIIEKFHELQKDNLEFKEGLVERYLDLENKMRPLTSVTPSSTGLDENKIISLFSSGFGIDDIAKQLRIGTGEVEFVLKLHDIK